MLPIIIFGGSQADRASEVIKFVTPKNQLIHLTSLTASILISQIHELARSLSLTASSPRIVWLEEAQTLTLPAQNALLKMLEEPPSHTHFLLTTPTKTALLPTILSRCTTLKISPSRETNNSDTELAILKQAILSPPGARLLLANSLGGKRPALLTWTEAVLKSLETKLTPTSSPASLKILSQIGALTSLTHTQLSANCNPTLTIQNLFLSLPQQRSHSS
ncbi:MAG: hypothetical protein ABII80_01940 [bacterium]